MVCYEIRVIVDLIGFYIDLLSDVLITMYTF